MDEPHINLGVTTTGCSFNAKRLVEMYRPSIWGDLFSVFILFTTFFVGISYFSTMNQTTALKQDWDNVKCNPSVLPFAGHIMQSEHGGDPYAFTQQNFVQCNRSILEKITDGAFKPIQDAMDETKKTFDSLRDSTSEIQSVISKMSAVARGIFTLFVSWMSNILLEIRKVILIAKDSVGKNTAALQTAVYSLQAFYLTIKSMLGGIMSTVLTIMYSMIGVIIISWILPFTWPLAISLTATFGIIAAIMGTMSAFMVTTLKLHGPGIPGTPRKKSCFAINTMLRVNRSGEEQLVPIQQIVCGDLLVDITGDKNMVTSTLELDMLDETMFRCNKTGVCATGSHRIEVGSGNTTKLISICDHPDFRPIKYDEPTVYCLNTTTKRIPICGLVFSDWDDLDSNTIHQICSLLKCVPGDIHLYADKGFGKYDTCEIQGGEIKPISCIKIGDVLSSGQRIIGTVQTAIENNDIGELDGLINRNNDIDINQQFTHILTETGTATVSGRPVKDFNFIIDLVECLLWT